MKLYYVTLNTTEEAQTISQSLLSQQLALCTNWFPITCAYRWEEKIIVEPEIVLIIKTQSGYREEIEQVIQGHISYTNLVAEISPESVNQEFLKWLNTDIPRKPLTRVSQNNLSS